MSDTVEKTELILWLLKIWLARPKLELTELLHLALAQLNAGMSVAEQQEALAGLTSPNGQSR